MCLYTKITFMLQKVSGMFLLNIHCDVHEYNIRTQNSVHLPHSKSIVDWETPTLFSRPKVI